MRHILLVLSLLLPAASAAASGMSATCKFSTGKDGTISDGAKYRIGDAYMTATLVVIGRVGGMKDGQGGPDLRLRVATVVKGTVKPGGEVILTGPRCQGTACTGLSIARNVDFLLLLREVSPGLYGKVDGDGNDGCPTTFEVVNEVVKLPGGKEVPVKNAKTYFSGRPVPIPYP